MTARPATLVTRRRFLHIVAAQTGAFATGFPLAARAGVTRRMQRVAWSGIALGAEVSIEVFSVDAKAAHAALRECQIEVRRLEDVFSLYDARSAVGTLNHTGRLDDAPRELCELLGLARRFSELTEGAFDISIQPLCELLANRRAAVRDDEIAAVLARVDYRRINCDGRNIRFEAPGMKITLNGMAQGYITDRVADLLRERGFAHALVDLGEKRALGPHGAGRPWRVGVASPASRESLAGVLDLDGRALATSGGYGNVYAPGRRHHLLDARDGSSRHDFASITVLAPDAVTADTLSTCLAVISPERGSALLRRFPDVEAWTVRAPGDELVRFS